MVVIRRPWTWGALSGKAMSLRRSSDLGTLSRRRKAELNRTALAAYLNKAVREEDVQTFSLPPSCWALIARARFFLQSENDRPSQGLRRSRPIAACAIWGTRGKPLLFHSNEYTRRTISCTTGVVVSLTDRATVVMVDSVVFEMLEDQQT
jgi:hypothetical protein